MTTHAQIAVVEKELVHKDNSAEVLLTGSRALGHDTFVVRARWPDRHPFYSGTEGYDDPLLPIEAVRQAIPFLCHTAYGVPYGHRQIWNRLAFSFCPDALAARGASELELRVSCSDIARRADRLARMSMRVDLDRDGVRLGTARATFTNQSPAIYRRLRGPRADVRRALSRSLPLPPPVSPGRVARRHAEDVLLAPVGVSGLFQLRVDTTHPILFDHPVDHVPGMSLLEAARQAAHTAASGGSLVTGMEATFLQYAEFDAPCSVQTSVVHWLADRLTVRTRVGQHGKDAFRADVTLRQPPS
ncbi:ScbA/BarX family gamma-butyrolactone biosynthesis protein [Streptomyces uncialis]|uniref:ScbA/BarX family gamma-butyrolactone biosynthesis protein n=1 Tax=Streptomyces uncialis TaxID=1048205 RepID=UPI0033C0171E